MGGFLSHEGGGVGGRRRFDICHKKSGVFFKASRCLLLETQEKVYL